MPNRIVVVGSTNMDLTAHVPRLPEKGETILGGELSVALGGKGANQAVAAARLGADVMFITALGKDAYGQQALASFQKEGLHTEYLVWVDNQPTGIALILVELHGDNLIAVTSGANLSLMPEHIFVAESVIQAASCLVVQLEIPLQTVETAVELAYRHNVPVILNPAPAQKLPPSLLQKISFLTPNESEAALMAGVSVHNAVGALNSLHSQAPAMNIILTMGKQGAMIAGYSQKIIPSPKVDAIDTTAAGDAFNGALAVAIARGDELYKAVQYANIVAALSVTKPGAQPSLPMQSEVAAFIESLKSEK